MEKNWGDTPSATLRPSVKNGFGLYDDILHESHVNMQHSYGNVRLIHVNMMSMSRRNILMLIYARYRYHAA